MLTPDESTTVIAAVLVLGATLLQPLLPCQHRSALMNSLVLRHGLGFVLLLFFFAALPGTRDLDDPRLFLLSIAAYGAFLLTSRLSAPFWVALVLLLVALYAVNLFEVRNPIVVTEWRMDAWPVDWIQPTLEVVAVLVTLVGFLVYVGEKKIALRGKFDYVALLFGHEGGPKEKDRGPKEPVPWTTALEAAFRAVPNMGGGAYGLGSSSGTPAPTPSTDFPVIQFQQPRQEPVF